MDPIDARASRGAGGRAAKGAPRADARAAARSAAGKASRGVPRAAARSAARAAATLLRSGSGRVEGVIHVRAGACLTSLSIDGRECLHLPEPLASFLRHDRTGGVPLLFPWANRLRGDRLQLFGRRIDLSRLAGVHRDGQGRPMHGVLLRSSAFCLQSGGERAEATLDWTRHAALRKAFPLPLTLRIRWRLLEAREIISPTGSGRSALRSAAGIEIATEVEAHDSPLPLSFGWHPYLRLPGPRGGCRLQGPALSRVALLNGLPLRRMGALVLEPPAALDQPLVRTALDDHFAGAADGAVFRVTGSRGASVCVEFVRGYRFAQIYSPRGADFISVEPMVAPVAALSDRGPELRVLGPGERFEAIFRIRVVA